MSQAMNQKAATRKNKRSSARQPAAEVPEELSGAEKALEAVKPHLTTIGLVVVAVFLGTVVVAFMIRNRAEANAAPWQQLHNAMTYRSADVSGLQQVASNNPDSKAGSWALQFAGDEQMQSGLQMLGSDRDGGLALIRKAKESYQAIVDAPANAKSTMLQRRSQYSLAYANESLGEFETAKVLYQELVDAAPESAFAAPATRGINRCSDPAYAELFAKFESYEEPEIAPGPALPGERPSIDGFPDVDIPAGVTPPKENDFPTGNDNPASSTDENEESAKSGDDGKSAPKNEGQPEEADGKGNAEGDTPAKPPGTEAKEDPAEAKKSSGEDK